MSLSSSQIREQAFFLAFEKSFNDDLTAQEILDLAYETDVFEKNSKVEKMFITCCENIDEIDNSIKEYSKKWQFSRISKIALAVLRVAVCELKYFEKTPERVAVNEAVVLSKTYGGEDDYSFVNGILRSFTNARKAADDSTGD